MPFQGLGHEVEGAAGIHRRHADAAGQDLHHRAVARQHADIADRAPGDREGGQSQRLATAGEPFHETVGGDVGALSRIADEGRGRGEQHEVVELPLAGGGIQMLGADDLRADDRVEGSRVEIGDEAILQHHRPMDHAREPGGRRPRPLRGDRPPPRDW